MVVIAFLVCALGAWSAPTVDPSVAAEPFAPAQPSFSFTQDEEQPPIDRRPEIKELLDAFQTAVKARGEQDDEAVSVLDKLLAEYPNSGPKDHEAIAKAVGSALVERRKDLEPDRPDQRLAVASATALGRMGEEGGEQLLKQLSHKSLRDRPDAFRAVILSLGATRHDKGAKALSDLLTHHDAAVQAAASEALGNYAEADQKVRKEAFKSLLDTIMPVKNTVDTDPTNSEARQRYDTIATPILGSMRKLTGHGEGDFQEWQRWWNQNKNRDWTEA